MDGSVVGKAWTDSMCGEYATGIISDHSDDAEAVAATASHEMGHNYGMSHDSAECDCNAGDNQCLMTAVIGWNPPTQWSSCSKTVLKQGLDDHKCMHDQPPPNLLYGPPQCGNGIQEEGEECDCGSKECDCCDYKTCKLLPGAECTPFDGVCCSDSCQIKSRGSLCREAVSDCDVPEYCDDESLICPRNDFKHTGHQCGGGEGFCYGSHCKAKDGQCQSFLVEGQVQVPNASLSFKNIKSWQKNLRRRLQNSRRNLKVKKKPRNLQLKKNRNHPLKNAALKNKIEELQTLEALSEENENLRTKIEEAENDRRNLQ